MLHIEQIRPEHTWKLRRDVLYPNKTIGQMAMEEDNDGYHFAVFKDNYIVAVVSLFQRGADWQFRKFAVNDQVQQAGIGTKLLNYITNFVVQEHGTRLWCNARLSATGFYAKFDFTKTGEVFSKNGFEYIIMEKALPLM